MQGPNALSAAGEVRSVRVAIDEIDDTVPTLIDSLEILGEMRPVALILGCLMEVFDFGGEVAEGVDQFPVAPVVTAFPFVLLGNCHLSGPCELLGFARQHMRLPGEEIAARSSGASHHHGMQLFIGVSESR